MGLVEAIVYGIVQGLTEFLPISSTAHLRLLPVVMNRPDPGASFTAAIQLGTLVAVLLYFWRDLVAALTGWLRGLRGGEAAQTPEARLGWAIVVGTIPISIFGLLLKDRIETSFRSLYVVGAMLIVMGLLLAVADRRGRKERGMADVRALDGLWVGLWQAVALIPGASRSGSTITGALFAGFDRSTAARFSFLLSIPAILLAGVFNLAEHASVLLGSNLVPMLVANLFAFITGYASIAWLMNLLQKRSTMGFVVYRVLLGVALIALIAAGTLDPLAGLPVE